MNYLKLSKTPILAFFAVIFLFSLVTVPAYAQNADGENINSEGFRLVICDGPAGINDPKNHMINDPKDPESKIIDPVWYANEYNKNFIPCNFEGLMKQVQRLINVMIILGVVAALGGFSYAGYLYITGVPGNITRAYEIFKKVGIGFIIMLSAWAIVYQILSWLTDNNKFTGILN